MPLPTAIITINATDLGLAAFDPRRTKVWGRTNIPGETIVDTLDNDIYLGSSKGVIDPTGTTATLSVPIVSEFANPTSWQTYIHIDYPDSAPGHGKGRATRTFGPFTITESDNLANLITEQEVPPTYLSGITATLDTYVTDAEAAASSAAVERAGAEAANDAAQALVLSDLGTTDGQTRALVENPASQTAVALSATIDAALEGFDLGPGVHHLDAFNDFFEGAANDFVTGQTVASTTTTAAVSAGATVLPLASVTSLLAGTVLILNGATADQQLVSVVSVAGNNATVTPAVGTALASGATVAPLWVNSAHLTTAGYNAFAYWTVNHLDAAGGPIITPAAGERVTFFGDSWMDGKTAWETQLLAAHPTAVVTNVGVSGNTAAAMLARFDTDVPADSKYVVFNEPGVNDILQATTTATFFDNLATLIRKIKAVGAVPVYTGMVPLSDNTTLSTLRASQISIEPDAYQGVAGSLLAQTQGSTQNAAHGNAALAKVTTGLKDTAFGDTALGAVTTGSGNVGIGYRAGRQVTTGNGHVLIGQDAGQALTTASDVIAIGGQALYSATGTGHTAVGRSAGYAPNAVGANATTTAINQTLVGKGTGQSSPTQVNDITCIGYNAIAGAAKGTSIGSAARADHAGSVALGSDTVTTAAGQVMVGPRDVEITDTTKGIVLKSPDGTRYRVAVANGGALSAVAA